MPTVMLSVALAVDVQARADAIAIAIGGVLHARGIQRVVADHFIAIAHVARDRDLAGPVRAFHLGDFGRLRGGFLAQAARFGLQIIVLRLEFSSCAFSSRSRSSARVLLLELVDALHESLQLFADLRQFVRAGSLRAGGQVDRAAATAAAIIMFFTVVSVRWSGARSDVTRSSRERVSDDVIRTDCYRKIAARRTNVATLATCDCDEHADDASSLQDAVDDSLRQLSHCAADRLRHAGARHDAMRRGNDR